MFSRQTIEKELIPWFASYLNESATQAQSGHPIKSWLCAYCGYQHLCPLKGGAAS
jgi:hypothetical protein